MPQDLQFFNSLGGFTADGREYCLLIKAQETHSGPLNGQPNPHEAVLSGVASGALDQRGCQSQVRFSRFREWGGMHLGCQQPDQSADWWSNDPVVDPPSEVVYLRDEATGQTWCPTPSPIAAEEPTVVRHGQGYTAFERNSHGIEHRLTLLVPTSDPVKLIHLSVRNTSNQFGSSRRPTMPS